MTDSRIIRIENWDKRHRLCKLFDLRSAVVYEGTSLSGRRLVACDQRLRVKNWANAKLGPPCCIDWHSEYLNTNSEWYQGYNDAGEYVIAFQNPKLRDWALIL